ncbi:hypothetical protein [Saccharopolyspora griseoalba]|uniref:Uncharacterized protein n=1 Tax=Saccharopolyspora griseoalba TaxID=1431848 RepID=A0ABW2LP20_9PSEU
MDLGLRTSTLPVKRPVDLGTLPLGRSVNVTRSMMSTDERAAVKGIENAEGDIGLFQAAREASASVHYGDRHTTTIVYTDRGGGLNEERVSTSVVADVQLGDRFVAPTGFKRAADMLLAERAVLVDGDPGIGRSTAARRLFQPFDGGKTRYRILSLDDEGREVSLDPEAVQPGEPLLLDLADAAQDVFLDVQDKLLQLWASVVAQGAMLVIVPPVGVDDCLRPEWDELRAPIQRPRGSEVLAKHLEAESMDYDADVLESLTFLRPHLDNDPMRELVRLCRRAVEARESNPDDVATNWLKSACTDVGGLRREVADAVEGWSGKWRALALSAAMLKDSNPDSVHLAAEKLRNRLQYRIYRPHVLEQDALNAMLARVGATTNERDEVGFTKTYYEGVLRDYFWENFPDMRRELGHWVGDCIVDFGFTNEDRDRLVARFAEQARRSGRIVDLCELASRLAPVKEGKPRTRPWAASALVYGLQENSANGSAAVVRRRIYEWAAKSTVASDLAHVLVSVCADVMSETHADQAIVRLRLLTTHVDPSVARAASDAMVRLAEDSRSYRRLLWRMRIWLEERRKESDAALFLAVSHPSRLIATSGSSEPLIVNRGLRRQLTSCWRVVFANAVQTWRSAAEGWMEASVGDRHGAQLLGVVVTGAGGDRATLAWLHVICRDWVAAADDLDEREERRRTFRNLSMKIDAALGLQLAGT